MTLNDQNFRRDKRVTFTTRATVATVSGSSDRIEEASTIDLSESGVRLRMNAQLAPGQIVHLYLNKRPDQCRVVWSDPVRSNNGCIVGLEFVYPLPDSRRHAVPPSSQFEPIN